MATGCSAGCSRGRCTRSPQENPRAAGQAVCGPCAGLTHGGSNHLACKWGYPVMPFVKQLANVACVWASFGLLAVAELSDSAGPGLLSVSAGSGSTTSAGMGSGHTLVFISSLCCDIPVSKCRGATAYPVLGRQAQTQYVSPWVTVLRWDFPTWSGRSTAFACSCATRTNGGDQKAWMVAWCRQFEHEDGF